MLTHPAALWVVLGSAGLADLVNYMRCRRMAAGKDGHRGHAA